MAKPRLILYVDIVSPFAYLAFHVTRNSPIFRDCDITYIPLLLGGVMKACNNTPPINIKNKNEWINTERIRWARLFDIRMAEEKPEGFPVNTLSVQRALCMITLLAPKFLPDILAALYHDFFVERKAIQKFENFLPILKRILGEEVAQEVLAKSTSDEAKKLLTANTQKAIEGGCFGLPWFVATNMEGRTESFWGFDHIGQVTNFLELGSLRGDSEGGKGWKAML